MNVSDLIYIHNCMKKIEKTKNTKCYELIIDGEVNVERVGSSL